jgi:hypothetical protein
MYHKPSQLYEKNINLLYFTIAEQNLHYYWEKV